MAELTRYVVLAPDGSRALADLPDNICGDQPVKAPGWLIRQMGLGASPPSEWRLHSTELRQDDHRERNQADGLGPMRKLFLVRVATASATRAPADPRQARLRAERMRLETLNAESDNVRVEPLNVMDGSEPEHYRVTFLCRGIIGIEPSTQAPIYADRHQVEILCDDDFPSEPPKLRWITAIWHPNIQHNGHKGVCINESEWLGGMGLDDLCRLMFEMVQYKNYHAENTRPYPLDQAVATWVRDYAERRGLVKKGKVSIDNRPFTRATDPSVVTLRAAPPPPMGRVRVVTRGERAEPSPGSRLIRVVGSKPRDLSDTARTNVGRITITKKE
ncbi:MAG: ubiquitin-conjugating enzyme E2 [Blastocatellia bacterium]